MKRRNVLSTLKTLQSGALNTRPGVFVLSALFSTGLVLATSQSIALTKLSDDAMSDVSGAGLAFAFDDFRFQMEPTSYFGNLGSVPSNDPGATNGYKGDYLWIGTSITRGYTGSTPDYSKLYNFSDYINTTDGKFNMNPVSTASAAAAIEYTDMFGGTQTLSYPIAQGGAQGYAEVNNPFVMRVHSYKGVGLNPARTDWVEDVDHTVLELVGPTHSTPFRWAFYGQVNAFQDDGTTPLVAATNPLTSAPFSTLENQEIIIGSPTSRFRPDGTNPAGDGTGIEIGCSGAGTGITGCGNNAYQIMGPVFRMYQSMGEGTDDQTLGMLYHHRLSGDYRFSVNETGSRTAEGGARIPTFDAQEGMYFSHVNAYLPMGQLHYQSLLVSGVQDTNGNYTGDFITETSQIPDDPQVYNDFYGYPGNAGNTAPLAIAAQGYNRHPYNGYMRDRYYETHGYVRWGNNFPTAAEIVTELGSGDASKITNNLLGNGVTGTAGYTALSGNGVLAGDGATCGGSNAQQCVSYHLKPYTLNDSNFGPNVYSSNITATINVGLCEGSRDHFCNHFSGTSSNVQQTIPINIGSGTPVGQVSNKGDLLSAGGMVFLARNGGSWTVPQNPNLASSIASESTNLLIFGNWDVKRELTQNSGSGGNWTLQPDTTPNTAIINQRATTVIQGNGGATATMQVTGINLGSSRVEGMLIHHLKVTTLGAAN